MQYGEFIDNGRVYRINTPFTPTKWTNYLFNDNYITEVSQTLQGGGSVIENYSPQEYIGKKRGFYISSDEGVFSLNDIPSDFYCDHGIYDTNLHMSKYGIAADIRVFVPTDVPCEVWTIKLRNDSENKKEISLYSFFEFSGFDPMFGHCSYEDGIMYRYSFPHHIKYEEKKAVENDRMYSYVYPTVKPDSFDGDGVRFCGCEDYNVKLPEAVKKGKCSNIEGVRRCFFASAMQHKFIITSGETAQISFIIGKERTLDDVKKLVNNFDIEDEYRKIENLWKQRINTITVQTPDKELNYMVNYWIKKQSILLTRLNRMSPYSPVRNQLQDAIGYSMIEPYEALRLALKVLRRQHCSGYLKQWYMADGSPDKGLCLLNHSDGSMWLILAMVEIIDNCGDMSIYDNKEKYIDSDNAETVYEHLVKAARYMCGMKGEHGLCLMLDGDWTDPANGPGRMGKGESTWLTEASAYAIDSLTKVASLRGDIDIENELKKLSSELKAAVNEHCFIDGYYVAGFDDLGKPYGTATDEEGSIFINSQVWAIISKIAQDEKLAGAVAAIDKLNTPFGPRVLYPAFTKWNDTWGRISVKQAGTTENGAVYSHAAMFKAYSDCVRGDMNAAYKTIKSILPTNPLNPPEKNEQLPLFIPNYYFALEGSENMGKSSCHYGTGTAAWFIWVIVKHILEPGLNGGTLPDGWEGHCSVNREND